MELSVLVAFAEVSQPGPGPGVVTPAEGIDLSEGHTDFTRSTLDGTTAPQVGRTVHCGAPMQPSAPVIGLEAASHTLVSAAAIETEPFPASQDSAGHLIELLQEIGQGRHEAFSEFYRLTSRRVFGVVRRVVLDRGLSEEVTQEVFIVVWRDAAAYDPALGSPTGWLLTIAHRRAVDKVRWHQSSTNRDARWASASWTRPYDEVAASSMERMDALQLRNSLAALPPLQREAIVLAYFGPLTYREVAERLSKPLPTIKSRIRDGLKQLREQLEPA
ncbi:sigma-70 family RNA polymerase sigma factor [Pseudarthrobacter equi]|uniref:sigma-70 family RNA polymerase sigma factor n=1 Tax=Pseudarthrobacter equi TaxID=728066 RepID=UPI0028D4AA63|nr:sigma-70 family RNA polymerase sigma factor [Pseudarthrobacter equi]